MNMVARHSNKLLSYKEYPTKETIRQVLGEACEHIETARTELLKSILIQDFENKYAHQGDKEGRLYLFKNNNGVVPYTCQSLNIAVYIYPIEFMDSESD